MRLKRNKSQFEKFVEALDYEHIAFDQCRPGNSIPMILVIVALVVACRYVPFLHKATGLQNAVIPVGLVLIAGSCSIAAWKVYPREKLGAVFLFFDSTMYGAALLSWSVLSSPPASHIIAGFWLVSLMLWAFLFPFTVLGVVSAFLGPAVTLFVGKPDGTSLILFVFALSFYIFLSRTTKSRKAQERRMARAEDVLKKVDDLMQDHREDVFGKSRLHLAGLFHGLKNEFALASWNLTYLQDHADFNEENEEVLRDTQTSMSKIAGAFEQTIQKLRGDAEEDNVFRLKSIVSVLEEEKVKRKGALSFEIGPDVWVAGSFEYISIVLDNLIDNALEAGASKIRIDSALIHDKTSVSLTVSDNGPGLPKSVQERLFEPFNTAGKEHGTGLGIYLSGRMIESMGGEISLRRTGRDGTEFEIVLPVSGNGTMTPSEVETGQEDASGQENKGLAP